ncbi:MAG: (2Fe-2S)-binding protein [Thaumarchaeota archaeon]|nr:(2Fe-2S)-binding protein [Candidatus Calditenuaceae archaeon]MDW8187398.1 (2Fe-2S)-binding protein [Nitrososphaerota archaeon]
MSRRIEKEFRFFLNGKAMTVRAPPCHTLLEILRYELRMTGTKEGCARGDCGECTVLLNGEPVHSCLTVMTQVEGKNVTTIEGIDPEHRLVRSFVEAGAVQCGHCTPGLIISSYALLLKRPRPTEEEVKEAIRGNLCRCTGYSKIVKAVLSAAGV